MRDESLEFVYEAIKRCSAQAQDLEIGLDDLIHIVALVSTMFDEEDGEKLGNFLKVLFTRIERAQTNENKNIRS